MTYECAQCSLPDAYDGQGDGIGSCECERCEYCGGPPLMCSCESDAEYYGCSDAQCVCGGAS